jgi:hypothetical protein
MLSEFGGSELSAASQQAVACSRTWSTAALPLLSDAARLEAADR